ncbi:hypothetical protein K440DRAFT_204543 [Wilcoxina mikolae CBS 423.85]|nr:hypothetical protein K440DRAFT_204543 [Wilcoxina mikolae CBS 423.85]
MFFVRVYGRKSTYNGHCSSDPTNSSLRPTCLCCACSCAYRKIQRYTKPRLTAYSANRTGHYETEDVGRGRGGKGGCILAYIFSLVFTSSPLSSSRSIGAKSVSSSSPAHKLFEQV